LPRLFLQITMKTFPLQNLQAILFLIFICLMLWVGFGPIQLGGPVSYVIISGNSMEPEFQVGDLVLARRESFYQLNDQVVYNHPKVGYVFHRIIDQNQGRFTLKGDNNEWLDSHQPTPEDILGKFWFKIPGASDWITALRKPINFTGLAVIITAIIGSIFLIPEKGSGRKKKGPGRIMEKKNRPPSSGDYRQEILFILGILALAALALGLIAFTRPLTMEIVDDIFYSHQGDFTYTASSEPGIYDPAGIKTGDPIYPRLACQVEMDFEYKFFSPRMTSAEKNDLTGTFSLRAVVIDPDSWNRSQQLISDYHFSGSSTRADSSVNICRILNMVREKEAKTGAEVRWYTLKIIPEVQISGKLAGIDFEDTYQPEINFNLSETVLRKLDGEDGFQLSQEGLLPNTTEIENILTIFDHHIRVLSARKTAALVLGLCFLGAVYPAWSLYRDWKSSSAARIRVQNQPLLIDVREGSLKKRSQKVIQVMTFTDLRKMAGRYGAVILHEDDGGTHIYTIEDGGILYQFILEEGSEAAAGELPNTDEETR